MNQLSNVAVIYNPNSTGASKEKAEELIETLRDHGFPVPIELTPTEHAGHATQLAYDIAKQSERPLIVSSSGDGGYNEVINGALQAQQEGAHPVCAVLPAGNANDHRRTVKRRPLVEAISRQMVSRIDVLKVTIAHPDGSETVRYAHSYVGLGLTPTVAVELNRNRLTRIKETWIVARSLHRLEPFEIRVNGKVRAFDSVVFANISQMAKVLTIAEDAEPDDGEFEVVAFPYKNKPRLLFLLVKAMLTGIGGKKATKYSFGVVKDMPAQFDGEIVDVRAGDEVTVRVMARALSTIR